MNYNILPKIVIRFPVKPQKSSFSKEELICLFKKREYKDALFLSSPDLSEQFEKHVANLSLDQAGDKFYVSLAKYALRMHNRSTPFGLMAGCGVSNFDNNLILDTYQNKTDVTLDSAYVNFLSDSLSNAPGIKSKLKYWANNSIYRVGNDVRYTYGDQSGSQIVYELSTIKSMFLLDVILSNARFGITFKDLIALICKEGISIDKAEEYINDLIKNQLLISGLKPSVIGENPFDKLISKLSILSLDDSEDNLSAKYLNDIKNLLTCHDKKSSLITLYNDVYEIIKRFKIPINHNRLLKADLFNNPKPKDENAEFSLSLLQSSLLNATAILDRLTRRSSSRNLEEFTSKFRDRYQDQEVPLGIALDNDLGIGYGTYNEAHLGPHQTNENKEIIWTAVDRFLSRKLTECAKNNEQVLQIDLKELDYLPRNSQNLPPTIFAHFVYFNNYSGDYNISLKYIGGPGAINLIGRFGKLNEIQEIIQDIAKKEAHYHSDCIVAEICHSPQYALGNVLQRTTVRDYEIPYLTPSSLPTENQIWIDDLFLSIRNEKLYLRSKKLNKEVKPRLSNAHFFSKNSLPIYHFLCDIQFVDQKYPFYFNWGSIADNFQFLPRVQTGSVILSPARWQISIKEINELLSKPLNDLKIWFKNKNLPSIFYLNEQDTEIVIDTTSDLSIMIFKEALKRKETLTLVEYLYSDTDSLLKDQFGNPYSNEIIAFFKTNEEKKQIKTHSFEAEKKAVIRKFSLGSQWLCYNLFCGTQTADKLLILNLRTITKKLEKLNLIDKWFFVRYNDPDFHIRFRMHIPDIKLLGEVIQIFNHSIRINVNNDTIWKIQNETYNRELERYSRKHINEIESLFHIDSEFILYAIKFMPDEHDRFNFALKLVFDTINLFGIDGLMFSKEHKEAFATEFNRSKYEIDKIYRSQKQIINMVLENTDKFFSKKIHQYINNRKNKFNIIITQSNYFEKSNRKKIASSIIHMSINRIFKDFNRVHESSIYEMLFRYYTSKQFRK